MRRQGPFLALSCAISDAAKVGGTFLTESRDAFPNDVHLQRTKVIQNLISVCGCGCVLFW